MTRLLGLPPIEVTMPKPVVLPNEHGTALLRVSDAWGSGCDVGKDGSKWNVSVFGSPWPKHPCKAAAASGYTCGKTRGLISYSNDSYDNNDSYDLAMTETCLCAKN